MATSRTSPRSRARRPPARAAVSPDRMLTVVVMALVAFGLVMVYSTSSVTAVLDQSDPLGMVTRQGAYAVVGFALYAVFVRMSPEGLKRLGPVLVGASGVLLLAVLVMGTEVKGSKRWISLGGMGNLQPSEVAKLAIVLWVAQAIARHPRGVTELRGLMPFGVVTGVIAVLILVEPDMETAVIVCAIALTMLLVAGMRGTHLAGVLGGGVFLVIVGIMIEPYRTQRFFSFLDPWSDPTGPGYQAIQAQVALGSGGISGVGLGDGVQKAFYLPEAHTDMILATVGEELGLIGVFAVLAAFVLFALAGYRIALKARDLHQQVLAAGITTMVVAQAVVNMGAVLGVMPVAGVPLPFVSFGGSSLIILLACTGILVNIGRRTQHHARRVPVPSSREGADRGRGDGRTRDARAGGRRRAAGAGG
ncbi:MAG: putative lipid II flippase FtsW [Thermoleophilia bacterium]